MQICFQDLQNVIHYSPSASFRQTEKKILDTILGEGSMGTYDSRIRPSGMSLNITGDDMGELVNYAIEN